MQPFPSALRGRGTNNASSGSFRCWSSAAREGNTGTPQPRPGDVIVWAVEGTVSGCAVGKGHVGFFTGKAPDGRYKTLGGNQLDPSIRKSAVVEKLIGPSFNRSDGRCRFHSIRTVNL